MPIAEDEGDYCRICRGEGTIAQPLFYPCKCSGSIKFVHQDCLMEWLSHSQKKYCELCKTPFRFTKLYDRSMPSTLPMPLFLRQITLHGFRVVTRWMRYIMVGFVWMCWLPWSIRQVWRGLFWLADGSWISEKDVQEAMLTELATLASNQTSSADTSTAAANSTIAEVILKVLPTALAPLSGFLGISTGELLLVKLTRLLYPNLFRWSMNLVSAANSTDEASFLPLSDRQPSLLSDVALMNSLTSYPFVNNALIDAAEGQIVCLLIITAFILIFLIREWVINQQPIIDMPDPDRQDPAPAPVQVEELPAPAPWAARRRRRGLLRGVEPNENNQDAPARNGPRPRAIPRPPRRAITDDNIARTTQAEAELHIPPDLRPRSVSFTPEQRGFDEGFPPERQTTPQSSPDNENMVEVSPPLLPRGAFDDAANIHRAIEERSLHQALDVWQDSSDGFNFSEASNSWEGMHGLSTNQTPGSSPSEQAHAAELFSLERSHEGTALSDGEPDYWASPIIDADDNGTKFSLPDSSQGEASELLISASRRSSEIHLTVFDGGQLGEQSAFGANTELPAVPVEDLDISSDNIGLFTPPSTDPDLMASNSVQQRHELEVDATSEGSATSEVIPADRSRFEPIFAWLWHTDGYVPQPTDPVQLNNHHLAQAIDDEMFPNRVGQANDHDIDENNQERPPQQLEPILQNDAELNNQEAIEDAEDLDGILELIGAQGPIIGMVQNVIFSEFLITLTIAASVWLPYIWGKITLLMLANPVGVFVKAPLHLVSKTADMTVDLLLFISGLLGYFLNFITGVLKLLLNPLFPTLTNMLDVSLVESYSASLTQSSGSRLEKMITQTMFGLKPDLPTFSMQSHLALRVFKLWARYVVGSITKLDVSRSIGLLLKLHKSAVRGETLFHLRSIPLATVELIASIQDVLQSLSTDLKPTPLSKLEASDLNLLRWSTQDKLIAIALGYLFFATLGYIYLKLARLYFGLKDDEKVEGIVADSLQQAGGVLKVVVIIGIEMIIFPLYCGFLLDVALMPLFEGSDLSFTTCIYGQFSDNWTVCTLVYWDLLYVSFCTIRLHVSQNLQERVLYFIRDPDDPTFHPIRDVLERPVATQLGKIAFSAFIYGGLVIVCLGGVVWTLSFIDGVLPIRWATDEPRLAFPMDIIFYNFLLPLIVQKSEPSKKISTMYEWWLRGCASGLRLTHFLFGEEREDEKGSHIRRNWTAFLTQKKGDIKNPVIGEDRRILAEDREVEAYFYQDGTYVRAPATDSVRIPKGDRVFLEVNEKNERIDGNPDPDKGMHGKNDERFAKLYIPPNFQARIATFILLLWLFAAVTGVAFTIGPLVVGRKAIQIIARTGLPPNDLYAATVGVHLCGGVAYALSYWSACTNWLKVNIPAYFQNTRQALPQLISTMKYVFGLVYLGLTFGVVLPFVISFITEIYIHVPFYTYVSHKSTDLSSKSPTEISQKFPILPPTVYALQTWTLGLLYLRLLLRLALNYPNPQTRPASALRAITRNGWLQPDVALATRAFVLPATVVCFLFLTVPLSLAHFTVTIFRPLNPASIYRYAYPTLLAFGIQAYGLLLLRRQISVWRARIRDEVYLIGERLHNFTEVQKSHQPRGRKEAKGKARELARESETAFGEKVRTNWVSALMDMECTSHHTWIRN